MTTKTMKRKQKRFFYFSSSCLLHLLLSMYFVFSFSRVSLLILPSCPEKSSLVLEVHRNTYFLLCVFCLGGGNGEKTWRESLYATRKSSWINCDSFCENLLVAPGSADLWQSYQICVIWPPEYHIFQEPFFQKLWLGGPAGNSCFFFVCVENQFSAFCHFTVFSQKCIKRFFSKGRRKTK